jgi:acyl dehydratase
LRKENRSSNIVKVILGIYEEEPPLLFQNYFEDLEIDQSITTPTRTMTEADVVLFAGLTGDYNELHTSEYFNQKHTQFGKRVVHGLLVLSIAHGLMFRTNINDAGIAFASIDEWKFVAPVFIDDTIFVEITVKEKIPSRSKPDRGIVKFHFHIKKVNEEIVQQGIKVLMIRRRPSEIDKK